MKRTIYLFLALVCALTLSCDKMDKDNLPSRIDILNEDGGLDMGPGSTEELIFQVHPSDATFNYDVTSSGCQVSLLVDNM